MEHQLNSRTQQTRERLRVAVHRLFLQQGYLAISVDANLAEAGISSKETLYRHYANKEALFIDVLSHLTMEQPGFSEKLAALPIPHDLPSLQQALTSLAHEIVAMLSQPGYLPLVRMIATESSRFPQLGTLFFETVTQRGLSLIMTLLQSAREQELIADVNLEVVTHMLLGGIITFILINVVLAKEIEQPLLLSHTDTVVEITMRALRP